MSLSGTLEIFPLEEVLRLLARARQDGCLRVEGPGSGRIYIESGALTYATVESDEALRDQLLASGIASEEGLQRLDASRGSLEDALSPTVGGSALAELVREQCVESVYRIRRPGQGRFEFQVDSRPHYQTGQAFDIETIISESDRRAAEWADIETVVPDLSTPWRMIPEIDEESVTLSDTAWRYLAALEGACSIHELAGRLGLTTFQTARRMAELSRARLVEPITVPVDAPAPHEPAFVTAPTGDFDVDEEPAGYPTDEEPPEPVADPNRSWWLDENVEDDRAEPEATPEPEEPAEETVETGEEDESFLETVFGELEKTEDSEGEEPEGEEDGGFGLLRRRGLGAAFRELADS